MNTLITKANMVSEISKCTYRQYIFSYIPIYFKGQWHRNNKTMEHLKSCPFFDKRDGTKYSGDPQCQNLHFDDFGIPEINTEIEMQFKSNGKKEKQ